MTDNELIEKLKAMRAAGAQDSSTRAMHVLFGLIFDANIRELSTITKAVGVKSPEINIGRKLTSYVTVRPDVLRRWRP